MVGKYKVITLCGSTRSEVEYAEAHGKKVGYLFNNDILSHICDLFIKLAKTYRRLKNISSVVQQDFLKAYDYLRRIRGGKYQVSIKLKIQENTRKNKLS